MPRAWQERPPSQGSLRVHVWVRGPRQHSASHLLAYLVVHWLCFLHPISPIFRLPPRPPACPPACPISELRATLGETKRDASAPPPRLTKMQRTHVGGWVVGGGGWEAERRRSKQL